MNPIPRVSVTIFLFLALLMGCASQKDVLILDERLMILERQNQELQQKNDSLQAVINKEMDRVGKSNLNTETSLRTQYAGMSANMEAVQQEIRLLSGRIEELAHQLGDPTKNNQAKIDEMSLFAAKLDQRLAEIERYLNLEGANQKTGAPQNRNVAVPDSSGPAKTATTADELYAAAKKDFDAGQMEKSRRQFLEFLKSNPNSENADNAQFWIGESYYGEKWFEKAILEYQTVIEKYPKGNKVPSAMLKQGMAFLQLGDKANAGLIWKELVKKFPASNEAKIATTKLKEL